MIKIFKNKIKTIIDEKFHQYRHHSDLRHESILLQNGRIWCSLLPKDKPVPIEETEFKVFSQWGDDGIIQYLISYLNIQNKIFVEFGVEDYTESNTRFLLFNNNWRGLVLDGSESNIEKIRSSYYFWKYDLKTKAAFITAENVNKVISNEGLSGEIGLLHIDIDGNDYWVWKALNIVEPIIMIVEYNSVFGAERPITIPYRDDFSWTEAHYSNLYFGASIVSLFDLAQEKGYAFIGCNTAGNNAYFVKRKYLRDLKPLTIEEGFVESKFRQSRDEKGRLNYLGRTEQNKILKGLPVYNTRDGKNEYV